MASSDPSDQVHRLIKKELDSGSATSLEEAKAIYRGYRLALSITPREAVCPLHQAALLTSVALARRVFLGGVTVDLDGDASLRIPVRLGDTLANAVTALGGTLGAAIDGTPEVIIGGSSRGRRKGFCIRTAMAGWRGGILPVDSELMPEDGPAMPLAAMLAAALAVNEAFLFVNGGTLAAGRRAVGFSLWNPSPKINWLDGGEGEPTLEFLPSNLWLVGLGHLGQAYLWGLGLLPYASPSDVSLVLQDVDPITTSTESTSILTASTMVGLKKTRAMAAWAESRGFKTRIQERLFAANFKRQEGEPQVALCGVDNGHSRRSLDQVGFKLILEAGLGRGPRDFRTMRLHTLPGTKPAAELWTSDESHEDFSKNRAYQRMIETNEFDQCGVALLAGKAVGAPFTGAVASTLVLSELLRMLHGGRLNCLLDLDLLAIEHRQTVLNPNRFQDFNPGFTACKG